MLIYLPSTWMFYGKRNYHKISSVKICILKYEKDFYFIENPHREKTIDISSILTELSLMYDHMKVWINK